MKDWAEAYPAPAGEHEIREAWHLHERFCLWVADKRGADKRPLLDVGVGTGAFLAAFADRGHTVIGVDSNAHIVDQVNWLIASRGLDGVADVRLADALALPFADRTFSVAYSQGLLEHFGPEEVEALLREQMRVADLVVFSVPTPKWVDEPLVLPEYRRTDGEWASLLEGLGLQIEMSFGYWNQMHAVVVLRSSDNPPAALAIPEDVTIEWPADQLPDEPEPELTLPPPVVKRKRSKRR